MLGIEQGKIVYWSGKTGNTERFVSKIGLPSIRIANHGDPVRVEEPFVLITPTYADGLGRGAIPKPVDRFLNAPGNRRWLLGVIGGGNRNFGRMFAQGATAVSVNCGVPVLHRFELAGMPADVDRVREGLIRLWTAQSKTSLAA
ncbi:class Ib ribonucleoside-diphosphate reductase assembly flavoprotein NrdI [Leisingera sp. XS_AS12]|uniref:class Ib ribonucleoside-diphosphate reductase assembly flavoprotein NrdI n=1 Tax=Leisingera TaxID=191028 RepID=UPI00040A6C4D|nr:class Ib ribonucleoside-diphosphate reductase assembly flavoprotein NrdI [Leisingera caerulea]